MNITAIVNVHNEGFGAWRSLRAAWAALQQLPAEKTGELLIVLDAPTDDTLDCVRAFSESRYGSRIKVRDVVSAHGDLGLARNLGVTEARGDVVAFLDGDDVWGRSWLARALAYLAEQPSACIAHPQLNVNFGADHMWWEHIDSRRPDFDPSVFMFTNHWTSAALAPRALFLAHPYARVGGGYGFEDWEWNTRTLAAGVAHVVVPETAHFIRRDARSMTNRHAAEGRVIRPNDFFEKRIEPIKNAGDPAALSINDWLQEEWRAANDVDPELWPNQREMINRRRYAAPSAGQLYDVYHRVRTVIAKDVTHLVLFAGLGGGADLRVHKYADAIVAAGGKPALVATDGKSLGFPGHDTIEIAKALEPLSLQDRARVVQRLMLQLQARGVTIHVVNSQIAWNAIVQNVDVFRGKIFASLYAYEDSPSGAVGGYAANGAFEQCRRALRAIITDNFAFTRELRERTGWQQALVAPTPMEPKGVKRRQRAEDESIRVLVAGRADWNKNLDLVFEIAARCLANGETILFDVIGESTDYHGFVALQKLKALPNVKLRPRYGSFAQLEPEKKYDVFLLTSHKEGMPNTVLEALAHGLPVIASPAGGLADCAIPEWPGRIVKSADLDEWIKHIKAAASASYNPALWLKERHSPEAFEAALRGAGYFDCIRVLEVPPKVADDQPRRQSAQDASSNAQDQA